MPHEAPSSHDEEDTETLGAWGLTRRERIWGLAAVAAVLGLVTLLVAVFWQPAPPRRVVMSTGAADGAYHAYALRYQAILARSGVELVLLPSAGALENLERLRHRRDGVSLALVQGGLAQPGDEDRVVSLGAVAYEPLWLFSRRAQPLQDFKELRGSRIAAGAPGSGTRQLVDALLGAYGPAAAGSFSV